MLDQQRAEENVAEMSTRPITGEHLLCSTEAIGERKRLALRGSQARKREAVLVGGPGGRYSVQGRDVVSCPVGAKLVCRSGVWRVSGGGSRRAHDACIWKEGLGQIAAAGGASGPQ